MTTTTATRPARTLSARLDAADALFLSLVGSSDAIDDDDVRAAYETAAERAEKALNVVIGQRRKNAHDVRVAELLVGDMVAILDSIR